MTEPRKQRATGRTDVSAYVPTPYDVPDDGPALSELHVSERFTGDIEGDGTVRVIQAALADGSKTFAGIERVRGVLAGHQGSFLLQVSGTVVGTEMHAEWFVVPASGTQQLARLRGDGGFDAQLGQHGTIWLDYFFE